FPASLPLAQGPQSPTSAPDPAQLKAEESSLYPDAHPYIDGTFDQMKKEMHDLKDMEPASNQESLPHLLAQIGAKADALLRQVPDLISDEVVTEFQQTEPDVKAWFLGFVATWIIFSSPNQVEAHFRYLGQQKIEGRD